MTPLPRLLLAVSIGALVAPSLGGCCWSPNKSADSGTAAPVVPEPVAPAWPAMPEPGPAPAFTVPAATKFTLANGIPVTLVTTGAVPLVELRLNVYTGSAADPAGKEGLARLVADMLNEGTKARGALALEEALQLLASDVSFGAGLDTSYVRMNALEDNLEPTLAIVAEMLSQPVFAEKDLARVIEDHKRSLLASKDDPNTVGRNVFNAVLWGDAYLGRPADGTVQTMAAIKRKDVAGFHGAAWTPANAGLVVVSRLDADQLKPMLDTTLGAWKAKGTAPVVSVTPPAPKSGLTVYWVDRPGASQSWVGVGNVAPGWDPEQSPLLMLGNEPLGGNFTARINMNLREDKGYTYGARSGFSTPHLGGLYRATATVKSDTTAPSITEFLAEISAALGDRPITDEEHGRAVSAVVQQQPGSFETMAGVLGEYGEADADKYPADYLATWADRIRGVTREAAQAAFAGAVSAGNLVIVVVGDRAAAGPAVQELGLGPIVALDDAGKPVKE